LSVLLYSLFQGGRMHTSYMWTFPSFIFKDTGKWLVCNLHALPTEALPGKRPETLLCGGKKSGPTLLPVVQKKRRLLEE